MKDKQRGNVIVGVIIGVVIGLAAALAVAVYVTKVPVPFLNKGPSRSAEQDAAEERIDRTVAVVEQHVRQHPLHIRFVARERHGGVRAVRQAIADELGRFAEEVAAALKSQPVSEGWCDDDVRMLAELYVDRLVTTAAALLDAEEDGAEGGAGQVVRVARRQLRLTRRKARP